jgi:phage-related protein
MARTLARGEKPLDWVGSSKMDFLAFPEPVKDEIGNSLGIVQFGGKHPAAVRFREVVYVLHAFQKKSPTGVRTARCDIALVEQRLKVAQRDYEARHGKAARRNDD